MSMQSITRTFVITSSTHDLSPSVGSKVLVDRAGVGSVNLRICDASSGEEKQLTASREPRARRQGFSGVWDEDIGFTLKMDGIQDTTLRCNFVVKNRGSDAWTAEEEGP